MEISVCMCIYVYVYTHKCHMGLYVRVCMCGKRGMVIVCGFLCMMICLGHFLRESSKSFFRFYGVTQISPWRENLGTRVRHGQGRVLEVLAFSLLNSLINPFLLVR